MKDKEMAEEYLDEKCKDCYMCSYSEHKNPYKICQRRKDRKQAFLAGLKAGRPQWHKVAEGDLPKKVGDYVTNIGVLTYDCYGNGVYKWHTPYCEACDYADVVGDDEVIAWCEIPTFDKE